MPAVFARGAGAHVAERVQPEPGSEDESRLQALADDPASDWRRLDDRPEGDTRRDPAPSGPPSRSATKDVWVDWAVSLGADRTEAEKATKNDLIAAYGPDANPTPSPDPGPDSGQNREE